MYLYLSKLRQGYQTEIGERGAMLSGGQKQRLAIARSVISNPRILLLDEATSALDPNAERIVQEALNNVAVGRTMVVIAHRLSTIRDADNIVVMSGGAIVEQGTHDSLIDSHGVYSNLVLAQDLGQGTEEGREAAPHGEKAEADGVSLRAVSTRPRDPDGIDAPEDAKGLSVNYSLIRSICIIIKEQRELWFPFLFMGLACIVGGKFHRVLFAYLTYSTVASQRGALWPQNGQ